MEAITKQTPQKRRFASTNFLPPFEYAVNTQDGSFQSKKKVTAGRTGCMLVIAREVGRWIDWIWIWIASQPKHIPHPHTSEVSGLRPSSDVAGAPR